MCVCTELKKSSSLTALATLQTFGVFPPLLLGTFCSCWWLKGGSFHTEVQQEVFKLDKRKDYLAEAVSVGLGSQGDYGIRFSLMGFLIQ